MKYKRLYAYIPLLLVALAATLAVSLPVQACGGQPCPTPVPKCGYAVGYNPPCQTATATPTATPKVTATRTSTPKVTATGTPKVTPTATPTQPPGGGCCDQPREDDPTPTPTATPTLPPPPTPTATPPGSLVPPVTGAPPVAPPQIVTTPTPKAAPPVIAGPPKAGTGFAESDNRVLMIGFALIAFAGLVIAVGNTMRPPR